MSQRLLKPVGPEIVLNGDMEVGDPPTNWTITGAGGSGAASADAHGGSQAMEVTYGTQTTTAEYGTQTLEAGERYQFTGWMKRGTCSQVRFEMYSTTPFVSLLDTGQVTPTSYTQYTLDFVMPARTTAGIYCRCYGSAGQTAYFDDISIKKYVEPTDNYGPTITPVSETVLVTGGTPDWHGRPVCEVVNGVVVMVYYSSSAHTVNDGALHIRFSDDYGATWTAEDTYLDASPVTNFPMNPAGAAAGQDANEPFLYVAPNGNLVLHMWRYDGDTSDYDGTYQSVSTDDGATWSVAAAVDFTGTVNDLQIWTTDDYFVSGGIIYAGGRDFLQNPDATIFVKSEDNGTTWDYVSTIVPSTAEVGLEYQGNSRIVAVCRDVNMTNATTGITYKAVSDDMGLTWNVDTSIANKIGRTGRHRIWTKTHLEAGANWENDQKLIMCGFDANPSRVNCLWFSLDGGGTWTFRRPIDIKYNDAGYGDLFYDPGNDRYVFIAYRGTTSAADIVQYVFTVNWNA